VLDTVENPKPGVPKLPLPDLNDPEVVEFAPFEKAPELVIAPVVSVLEPLLKFPEDVIGPVVMAFPPFEKAPELVIGPHDTAPVRVEIPELLIVDEITLFT